MNPQPRPSFPRGVQAFVLEAAERRRAIEDRLVALLARSGFSEVILPILDYAAPYERVTAGEDRLYRFVDREGELLSVRADFTPMAARALAPRLGSGGAAVFYRGDVVRDQEAGVGRPREFAQVGAELYGEAGEEADLRLLSLALAALEGIAPRHLNVTLGWAGLLPRLLSAVAPSLTRGSGDALLRTVAAVEERRVTEVLALLLESGARPTAAEELARALLLGFDPSAPLFRLPVLAAPAAALGRAAALARAALPGASIVVDLAEGASAPYYTGLTFSAHALGAPGVVVSGGRYDDLLGHFGLSRPAVGFSIGVEALGAALALGERDEAPRPLRIAAGKGRLLTRALELLGRSGVELPVADGRRLLVSDAAGAHELLLLKDDDVPTYVAHGGADVGIVGSDRVEESGEPVLPLLSLPFGACRVSLIGRAGEPFRPDGEPVRVGTKYRRVASRYFDARGIAHEVVPLAGSVELAAALRLTDVVVDLIETGATLAANGLVEIETISNSSATLVAGRSALATRRREIAALVARVQAAIEGAREGAARKGGSC